MQIFDNLTPAIIDNQRPMAAHAFNTAGGLFAFVIGPTYVNGKSIEARQLLRPIEGGQPLKRAFLSAFLDHCRTEGIEHSTPKQDSKDPKAVFVVVKLPRRQ